MQHVIADGARLSALRELSVLDTEPEPEFDRFTALASDLLGVPVSLVSLVDRDRQFFKSARGLAVPWVLAGQTPLSHSLCQHPVATGEPLIVSDARADARVADNLAVRDMDVVAYAGVPLRLADGHAVGALCAIDSEPREWSPRDVRILEDLAAAVSSLLDLRRALGRQSLHDALTGLPNRALAVACCEQLAHQHEGANLLALAIGIDDLSSVNAIYGTVVGDQLINLVARRIGGELSDDDVLGRLHGDTFVVLSPGIADAGAAAALADRLRAAIGEEPMATDAEQLHVSATIATTMAQVPADGDALINRALRSLSEAKAASARGQRIAAESGDAREARMRLRGALPGAVRRDEIVVDFQPIVELSTGRTRGYEALARWRHPELGRIRPADFIPVAEETGDIVRIGERVLRIACTQLAIWRSMLPLEDLLVTVNFSPVQLAVANIADVVEKILIDAGLPSSALTLEITEGVFLAPGALQRRNLEAIHELGVGLALDDFGTGYSTLSYLKRFPVDLIKIDRCFIDGLETDRRGAALMRAILAIGTGMDLDVVVEGVETRSQRELLRLAGCHWGQGFLFSEPLPAEQVTLPEAPVRPGPRAVAVVD